MGSWYPQGARRAAAEAGLEAGLELGLRGADAGAVRPGSPTLVWFRRDLRLTDNLALAGAVALGGPVIPVAVWEPPGGANDWAPAPRNRAWQARSLAALDHSLRLLGSRLVVRAGPAPGALARLCRETGATRLCCTALADPAGASEEARVMAAARELGVALAISPADYLFSPEEVRTREGGAYARFTPFWRACLHAAPPAPPGAAPEQLPAPAVWPSSLEPEALAGEIPAEAWRPLRWWVPGEEAAAAALCRFVDEGLARYEVDREVPAAAGTSRLSPHLHFGEVSIRSVWDAVAKRFPENVGTAAVGADASVAGFLAELGWREFARALLAAHPRSPDEPLRPEFAAFPWEDDPNALEAWRHGRTGFPLVDAGMRELAATGWMHNRVRMVVGSFLVKDLLLPWQEGAAWFWASLVDADLANNSLGWQWVAGSGVDAAPYFRVFNPVAQGERHDPAGHYVRRWVPELAKLPVAWVHRPWEAPPGVLTAAGVRLGDTYPAPLVDHREARARALAAYRSLRAPWTRPVGDDRVGG